uniref:Uncharacterized protein n=1 Tax=Rhizophora mucronata TaxID=61149 RepID=A0A2P2IYT4_RHIMU
MDPKLLYQVNHQSKKSEVTKNKAKRLIPLIHQNRKHACCCVF